MVNLNLNLNKGLRQARLSDKTDICNLLEFCFDTELDNLFKKCLEFSIEDNYSYVYIENDKVVGYVDIEKINKLNLHSVCMENKDIYKPLKKSLGSKINNYFEIRNLCVHPDYRGNDIGFKLVSTILNDYASSNFLVLGMNQTKIGKWLAEKIFIRLNFTKFTEKPNFWYPHSLKYGYDCNLCVKEPSDTMCCRCTGSVWLL